MPHGLSRKLRFAFIMHAVIASLAIVIGVYLAGGVVGRVLIKQRVNAEADLYWMGRAKDPAFALPKSANTNSYFVAAGQPADTVPAELRGFSPGFHELSDRYHVLLVDDRHDGRLYLDVTFYLLGAVTRWTALASILLALLAVYASTWFTYRASKRLVIPVTWLARQVSRWDPRSPDTSAIAPEKIPGGGSEVQLLGSALRELSQRTHDFVQRERDFTRDASHELRTPLTVMRMATDMMLSDPETPDRSRRSLMRMQHAGRDMETLIDAFLILARTADHAPLVEVFDVRDVVNEEVEKVRPMLLHKALQLDVVGDGSPRLHASPRVLSVMLAQLLENACTFTDEGHIEVRIERERVVITDTGIGMSSDIQQKVWDPFYRANPFHPSGKGIGLSIVRRLGERFDWPVTLESKPGMGTAVTISFAGHALN